MWQYNGITIREGRTWLGERADGSIVQQSPQWTLWSASEKEAAGLVEVIPEAAPDTRLYDWTRNPDSTITKTAIPVEDVKLSFKNKVKLEQRSLLAVTDWVIIREADVGTAVPSDIKTWRDAIRAKATEMEEAIDNAADADAIIELADNKSSILYDWPVDPALNV